MGDEDYETSVTDDYPFTPTRNVMTTNTMRVQAYFIDKQAWLHYVVIRLCCHYALAQADSSYQRERPSHQIGTGARPAGSRVNLSAGRTCNLCGDSSRQRGRPGCAPRSRRAASTGQGWGSG
jgi:hypothetical protein